MSTAISAKNKAGTISRDSVYADLDLGLNFHPGLKDIRPIYDIEAVKASVKNLVLTGGGDKPFHPEIGSDVFSYLFENADKFTSIGLSKAIVGVLTQYEPRVDQVNVDVVDNSDLNAWHITINFRVIAPDVATDVNFYLERLR